MNETNPSEDVTSMQHMTLRTRMCKKFTMFGQNSCRICTEPCVYGKEYIRRIDSGALQTGEQTVPLDGIEDFDLWLKHYKESKGLSYSQLVNHTGVSEITLNNTIKGKTRCTGKTIKKILKSIGVSVDTVKKEIEEIKAGKTEEEHHPSGETLQGIEEPHPEAPQKESILTEANGWTIITPARPGRKKKTEKTTACEKTSPTVETPEFIKPTTEYTLREFPPVRDANEERIRDLELKNERLKGQIDAYSWIIWQMLNIGPQEGDNG